MMRSVRCRHINECDSSYVAHPDPSPPARLSRAGPMGKKCASQARAEHRIGPLVLSNQCLMRIAQLIKKDVEEINMPVIGNQ